MRLPSDDHTPSCVCSVLARHVNREGSPRDTSYSHRSVPSAELKIPTDTNLSSGERLAAVSRLDWLMARTPSDFPLRSLQLSSRTVPTPPVDQASTPFSEAVNAGLPVVAE